MRLAEGVAADFEVLGGLGDVVAVLLEGGVDELALEIGHEFVEGLVAGGGDGFGFAEAAFEMEIGEAGGLDLGGGLEDDGAFNDVAEFADVAGPVVVEELLAGGSGQAANVFLHGGVVMGQEGFAEGDDVVAALAEGGRTELDDVEAVEKVFAEVVLADGFDDVAVGGGDEADVDVELFVAADAGEGAVFEEAEELGLKGRDMSPISSRKMVPAWASSTRPSFWRMAPVKEPFSWPKSSLSRRFSGMAAQLMRT